MRVGGIVERKRTFPRDLWVVSVLLWGQRKLHRAPPAARSKNGGAAASAGHTAQGRAPYKGDASLAHLWVVYSPPARGSGGRDRRALERPNRPGALTTGFEARSGARSDRYSLDAIDDDQEEKK